VNNVETEHVSPFAPPGFPGFITTTELALQSGSSLKQFTELLINALPCRHYLKPSLLVCFPVMVNKAVMTSLTCKSLTFAFPYRSLHGVFPPHAA